MKNKRLIKVSKFLSEDRSGDCRVGMSGSLSRAQKLQALKDENFYLEQRLAAMALHNQMLKSMGRENQTLS